VTTEAAWHQVTPDLVKAARSIRADLYVAHYVAALPAAAQAARLHGTRYAFDAEDFHLGDPPDGPEFDGVRRHTRAIESAYLPGAAYVTAASPGIAEAYASAYGIPAPTVVLNVFPRSHAPAAPTARGSAAPGPSVYWFSQTIGGDRGLECAARAVGLARSRPHLYLRGNPEAGFVDRLRSVAAGAGGEERIHLLPPEPPSEMERLASRYDLGFAGETGATANHRIALANKLFTYILAGIPVVASDIPAHRWLARRAGPAMSLHPVGSAEGLAAAIDGFLAEGGAVLARARAHAYALGQQSLNWDVEKALLIRKVEEVAGCRP
jgi:glycosyltransferase involved in cell wall biosynthesis